MIRFGTEHPECRYNNEIPPLSGNEIQTFIDHESKRPEIPPVDPAPPIPSDISHTVRLLLAHLGQLSFDHLKEGNVHLLTQSAALIRDLKGLDKRFPRDVAKFALLYVGQGQDDEYSIYRNSAGSKQYDDFVASLGWEIDLNSHPGYCGGLEPHMLNNGIALYYCDSMVEMIFHDITKMPTDTKDPKQLKKVIFF